MNDSDLEEHYFEILPGIFSFLNKLSLLSAVLLLGRAGHGRRHIVSGKKETTGIERKSHCSALSPKFDFEKAIGRQES